jgi:hypothetical protein
VTSVGLHYIDIRILDPTVWDEILAEIGARHRLIHRSTYFLFSQSVHL